MDAGRPKVVSKVERGGGEREIEAYMIYHLMRQAAIVLQNVVVLSSDCRSNFLCRRQYLRELVVGDVCEFGAVMLGDDQL